MRVLIVRIGAMGDVLHALPAVAALRRAAPGCEIGWAVDSRWAPLLGSPAVDRLHLVPTRAWKHEPLSLATARSILDLRRELRAMEYTITVDLQGTLRSAVVGSLAGAPLFLGSAEPRERPARLLYRQLMHTPSLHVVEQAADLLAGLTEQPLSLTDAPLPRDAAAERWAEEHLAGVSGPIVFLAPTAGWGAKMWPAERFGAVARAVRDRGCTVLVNATGEHDAVARAVVVSSGDTARAVPTTLAQMIALLRRADLVIAGDTGPLHVAAALGRPVVALFGPTDPARTGPWGTHARVLRDPGSVTDHSRVAAPEAGLLRVKVQDVLRAAGEMLGMDVPESTHESATQGSRRHGQRS